MMEMVNNMALIPCRVGLSKEIIAVFHMIKSQTDTQNDKNHEILSFSKFLRIFCQLFDRLGELELYKGSTRKMLVVQ